MEAIWKSIGDKPKAVRADCNIEALDRVDKPRAVQAETWKHWIVVVLC